MAKFAAIQLATFKEWKIDQHPNLVRLDSYDNFVTIPVNLPDYYHYSLVNFSQYKIFQ